METNHGYGCAREVILIAWAKRQGSTRARGSDFIQAVASSAVSES